MSVYLITFDDRHYKIGYSVKDADSRLASLQTGNPFKLRLIRSVETAKSASLERLLHSVFFKHRRVGEWFELGENGPSLFDAAVEKFASVTEVEPLTSLKVELTPEGEKFKGLIAAHLRREKERGTLPGFGLIYFSKKRRGNWVSFDVDLLDANYRLTEAAAERGWKWKSDYVKEAVLRGNKRPPGLTLGGGVTNHTTVFAEDLDRGISLVASLLSDPSNLMPNRTLSLKKPSTTHFHSAEEHFAEKMNCFYQRAEKGSVSVLADSYLQRLRDGDWEGLSETSRANYIKILSAYSSPAPSPSGG